jgi:hypothetical protein
LGVLIGEGHFGGDGRQPQVTLRMHARHEALFNWIEQTFPGGKLYGPYYHGDRHYLQWMARGSFLKEVLLPLLESHPIAQVDAHCGGRYEEMKARYGRQLGLTTGTPAQEPDDGPAGGAGEEPDREPRSTGRLDRPTAADIFERLRRERPM